MHFPPEVGLLKMLKIRLRFNSNSCLKVQICNQQKKEINPSQYPTGDLHHSQTNLCHSGVVPLIFYNILPPLTACSQYSLAQMPHTINNFSLPECR